LSNLKTTFYISSIHQLFADKTDKQQVRNFAEVRNFAWHWVCFF